MEKTTRLTVAPTPLFCPQTVSSYFRKILKSPIFLFLFTFLLILFFSVSSVSAKKPSKPKPQLQPWQIHGIVAALDDGDPRVKGYALNALTEYELQDLKSLGTKPEDIAQKAADIFNKDQDANVRDAAAYVLGNMGSAAAKYAPDLDNILKDEKVDADVRYYAAYALGNMGSAAAKYAPDLDNILKDEKVNAKVREYAAYALDISEKCQDLSLTGFRSCDRLLQT